MIYLPCQRWLGEREGCGKSSDHFVWVKWRKMPGCPPGLVRPPGAGGRPPPQSWRWRPSPPPPPSGQVSPGPAPPKWVSWANWFFRTWDDKSLKLNSISLIFLYIHSFGKLGEGFRTERIKTVGSFRKICKLI